MRFFTFFVCIFSLTVYTFADTMDEHDNVPEEDILIYEDDEDLKFEPKRASEDAFWIALSPETAMYRNSGFCFGAGFAFAYGKRASIGLKAAYFVNFEDRIDVLELGFLLRFYLLKGILNSVLYLQLTGGHALFIRGDDGISFPAHWGTMYGGPEIGWRFLFGNVFFLEPFVRAGYPYLFGGGISAGVVF